MTRTRPAVVMAISMLVTIAPPVAAEPCEAILTPMQMYSSSDGMYTQDGPVSQRVIGDCDGGGGGGGGSTPPPDTTRSAYYWSEQITDLANPLERASRFPVASSDANGVVALAPVPLPADLGSLESNVGAITNQDIVQAIVYYAVTDEFLIEQIDALLNDPRYQQLREDVQEDIVAGQYRDAVARLMQEYTPLDVWISCGSDRNPVQMRWVLVIPVMLPCSLEPTPARVAVYVSSIDDPTNPEDDIKFVQDNLGRLMADDITLRFVASNALEGATNVMSGFVYQHFGMGAFTDHRKDWEGRFAGRNLLHQGEATHIELAWDVTSVTGSFAVDDRLYFTHGARFSRDTSITWTLTDAADSVTGPYVDFPLAYWEGERGVVVGPAPRTHDPFGSIELHVNPAPNVYAVARVFSDGDRFDTSPAVEFRNETHEGGLKLRFYKQGAAVTAIPEDNWEAWATAYFGSSAFATAQLVGAPTRSELLFHPRGLEGPGRVEASAMSEARSNRALFRTALLTHHEFNASATFDYTRRAAMLVDEQTDPVTCAASAGMVLGGKLEEIYNDSGRTQPVWSSYRGILDEDVETFMDARWGYDMDGNKGALWWRGPSSPTHFAYDGTVGQPSSHAEAAKEYVWPMNTGEGRAPGSLPPGVDGCPTPG